VPLLGYAIACTRGGGSDGPPRWRLNARLLGDGFAVLCAIAVIAAPFVLIAVALAHAFHAPSLWRSEGVLLDVEAGTAATLVVALPWGVVMLLLMPHAVARFAMSGSPRDLFDYPASLRGVRRDFATWNLVIAAIVTAWAIGVACAALLCAGLVPGTFYAILVSAHATASLRPAGAHPPAG
jgi:hypothetical protein